MLKNREPELACKVEISPLAQAELDDIFAYISEHNYNAAVKFFEKLAKQFRLLSANQKLGKSCDSYVVGLRSFPYKDYVVFYFPIENGIEIYRVIHGARDIDSLFDEII